MGSIQILTLNLIAFKEAPDLSLIFNKENTCSLAGFSNKKQKFILEACDILQQIANGENLIKRVFRTPHPFLDKDRNFIKPYEIDSPNKDMTLSIILKINNDIYEYYIDIYLPYELLFEEFLKMNEKTLMHKTACSVKYLSNRDGKEEMIDGGYSNQEYLHLYEALPPYIAKKKGEGDLFAFRRVFSFLKLKFLPQTETLKVSFSQRY